MFLSIAIAGCVIPGLYQDRSHEVLQCTIWRNALRTVPSRNLWPNSSNQAKVIEDGASFRIEFEDMYFQFSIGLRALEYVSVEVPNEHRMSRPNSIISESEAHTFAAQYAQIFLGPSYSGVETGSPFTIDYLAGLFAVFPTYGNMKCRPYEFSSYVNLDVTNGKLINFAPAFLPPPLPPTTLNPTFSSDEAKMTSAGFIFQSSITGSLSEFSPPELCVLQTICFLNGIRPNWDFFNEAYRQNTAPQRGMLAYRVLQMPAGADGPIESYVDALNGQIVYVERRDIGYGGKGPGKQAIVMPFIWNIGPQAMTAFFGKASKKITIAEVSLSTKSFQGEGKPVHLSFGKVIILAQFDPKSGLLRHGAGKAARFGKPNSTMAKALYELTSKPYVPLKIPKMPKKR